MNVPREPFPEIDFRHRTQELIELTYRLNREYTQLIETSLVLRQESQSLSEESRPLRRAGLRLSWD
jgi:hypothetical protein